MTLFRSFLTIACTTALLTGCLGDITYLQEDTAKRTAAPVFMIPRDIPTENFVIQSYERIYLKNQPATIYIEGDSGSLSKTNILHMDPTPSDPIGLRIAAQDGGPNVIWLARPCQYNKGWQGGKSCPSEYWTTRKYAPEVIDTYNQTLDNIKAVYGIQSFDVVGYDGGAAIATILSSQRSDILSLRTIAGDLDPRTTAMVNKTNYSPESLNPTDFAAGVTAIPQRHFIGKNDHVTPPNVYNSFAEAAENTKCMNVSLVDNADHTSGWVEQWNVLKDLPVTCAPAPQPVPFDPTPLDGDKYHIKKK